MSEQAWEAMLARHRDKIRTAGPGSEPVRQALSLLRPDKPNPEQRFVIEGIWAHEKALREDLPLDSFLFCPEYWYSPAAVELADQTLQRAALACRVSRKLYERLSDRDGPDGFLSLCRFPVRDINAALGESSLVLVLDGLELPGNIGSVFRTADGAGVDAVLVVNRKGRLTHPQVIKGSMGAVFSLPWQEFARTGECRQWLEERGFTVFIADPHAGQTYYDASYGGRVALVVGSERFGVSAGWTGHAVRRIAIPMLGTCDSLNAAVAASIIVYEMSRHLKKGPVQRQ